MSGEFTFSLISDMHVDFPQPKTPYDKLEKFVVVAGDTSNGLGGTKFLQKLRNKGFDVFATDGNHEHYSNLREDRTYLQTQISFDAIIGPSVRWFDSGLMIVGANGWYPVTDEELWQNYMSDSRLGNLSAEDVNDLASAHARFIRSALENHDGPAVVVTHTAPCLDTLNPCFDGHFSNEWYWNPHMEQVLKEHSDQILVWCHGHTHAPSDKIVHGVRVVCNPRGYPGENPGWAPKTIKVSW